MGDMVDWDWADRRNMQTSMSSWGSSPCPLAKTFSWPIIERKQKYLFNSVPANIEYNKNYNNLNTKLLYFNFLNVLSWDLTKRSFSHFQRNSCKKYVLLMIRKNIPKINNHFSTTISNYFEAKVVLLSFHFLSLICVFFHKIIITGNKLHLYHRYTR